MFLVPAFHWAQAAPPSIGIEAPVTPVSGQLKASSFGYLSFVCNTARSTYLANQMPLLATSACNGGVATATSAPPYTNGSYRGNGQPRIPPCCYDNESPSDGDSKATGSIIGHTYQTREYNNIDNSKAISLCVQISLNGAL